MKRGRTNYHKKHEFLRKHANKSKNRVDISRVDNIVFVQVLNLGNAMVAVSTRDIIDVHINGGATHVVVELSKCYSLDSTFMGMLVGFANLIQENRLIHIRKTDKKPPIIITNANEKLINQLSLLGLNNIPNLIHIKEDSITFPDIEFYKIYEQPLDKTKRLNAILDAHLELMKINEMNQKTFKPFLNAIINELDDIENDK